MDDIEEAIISYRMAREAFPGVKAPEIYPMVLRRLGLDPDRYKLVAVPFQWAWRVTRCHHGRNDRTAGEDDMTG